jgi:hypothetical protein
VRPSPLGTSATLGLLYQLRMIDDYGAVGGMRIGRGSRSTRRKPAPVPLCPPQIPHDLTWDRTRAAGVGSQRITARAMARPRVEGNCEIPKLIGHETDLRFKLKNAISLTHEDCEGVIAGIGPDGKHYDPVL